jgi:hypothetical protein
MFDLGHQYRDCRRKVTVQPVAQSTRPQVFMAGGNPRRVKAQGMKERRVETVLERDDV